MDREAWRAAVHGLAKRYNQETEVNRTELKKKLAHKIFFWSKDLIFCSRVYRVNPSYHSTGLKRFKVSRKDMNSSQKISLQSIKLLSI